MGPDVQLTAIRSPICRLVVATFVIHVFTDPVGIETCAECVMVDYS